MNAGVFRRAWAYAFSAALLIAVLLPIAGDPSADSFPFSTYPMFSGRRSAVVAIPHLVVIDAAGASEPLPPEALGTDEVVQAFETIRQAIRQGDASVADLCADAADWARDHRNDAATIAVVTDTYNALNYFDGDKAPTSTAVHHECPVSG